MPRIAHVLGTLGTASGGLYTSVRRPAQVMSADGWPISVVTPEDGTPDDICATWHPTSIYRSSSVGPAAVGISPGISQALKQAGPDVLHQHGLWTPLFVAANLWARRTGCPVVISPRGMLAPWALRQSSLKKKLAWTLYQRRQLRRAACLHALTEQEACDVRALGVSAPIAVIPNGVDLPQRSPSADGTPLARRRLLFLGRLHEKKGVANLLAAWAEVCTRAPALAAAWQLVIAGWGEPRTERALKQTATELGLDGATLEWRGPVVGAEKDELLASATAFILPSLSEGHPMACLEAAAHGLPVFATAACNLDDFVAARGAIPISTEPKALAQTLAAQLADPALPQIGWRARNLVTRAYTWTHIADRWAAVYRWLAHGGTPPADVRFAT
ncbi:MAG: glycosyltransferase [Pseudomonadota bacterium]